MKRALYEYKITGVKTSIKYLERIMDCKDFVEGNYDTHFIEKNREHLSDTGEHSHYGEDMVVIAAYIDYREKLGRVFEAKEFLPLQNRWKKSTHIHHF
jgi:acetyl-CoA carboxylase biotin carboxylase subunit